MSNSHPDSLDTLAKSIVTGRCIAFVGAGVTAPVSGTWTQLLRAVAERLDAGSGRTDVMAGIESWLGPQGARTANASDYEAAAQFLRDSCDGGPPLEHEVKAVMETRYAGASRRSRTLVKSRIRQMLSIPFHAILTPNFDNFLDGGASERDASVYARVFRHTQPSSTWWHPSLSPGKWQAEASLHRPIVKLHGALGANPSIVLSSRDYARRLYLDPAYRTFMRSLMTSHTFLYLGFSFTDAYLNDIRRELLTLFPAANGASTEQPFRSYAIMPKLDPVRRQHFQLHEGIEVIEYDVAEGAKNPHAVPTPRCPLLQCWGGAAYGRVGAG